MSDDQGPQSFEELMPAVFETIEENPDKALTLYWNDKKVVVMDEEYFYELLRRRNETDEDKKERIIH